MDLHGERGGTRTLDPMIKSHNLTICNVAQSEAFYNLFLYKLNVLAYNP